VELLDANHAPLIANRVPPPDADSPIERAVTVDHRDVAWIRIWPVRSVDRPDNGAFLQARYTRIAWAALALILLTGALAPLVVQRVAAR